MRDRDAEVRNKTDQIGLEKVPGGLIRMLMLDEIHPESCPAPALGSLGGAEEVLPVPLREESKTHL